MSKARPTVSVYKADGSTEKAGLTLPQVFQASLRPDVVRIVHTNMNKNKRQAMAVKNEAGYDTAAASWGTGRAVARIPRVPGGGTHRSGQGAFGNMCRGGGMFNPTKIWRRWHRKTNVTQKRHALAASIAASAVPALVMARGHNIDEVPEMPLVISDESNKIEKTKEAVALLKTLGCAEDLQKVKDSKKIRCGKGKARNRRYVMRKGPLLVHNLSKEEMVDGSSICKSFRNIPGVEIAHVDRLNLLQLAPGGHFGRFVIYTESAMKRLSKLYGSFKGGAPLKKGYTLPRSAMTNTDIARIINSNEIQSVLNPRKETPRPRSCAQKKNPLRNKSVLGRLSPFAASLKKIAKRAHDKSNPKVVEAQKKRALKKKAVKKAHAKASKAYFKNLTEAYKPKVVEAEEADEE
jgi:large subunit ribosomal protein L4e